MPGGDEDTEAILFTLKSAHKIVLDSESQLPEPLPTVGSNQETAAQVTMQTDDDNTSSLCDAPSLPGGQPKVRFFLSQGDGESSEETSQLDHFELYGRNAVDSESGTDGGDESGFGAHKCGSGRTVDPTNATESDKLPHLSGRKRALLKRYFEEMDPFRLSVGHPTVAITESYV